MITIEKTTGNLLEIKIPEQLHTGDFKVFAPQVDHMIELYGNIRLLLDARRFKGWEKLEPLKSILILSKSTRRR